MWIELTEGGRLLNLADVRSIYIERNNGRARLVAGYPGGNYVHLTAYLSEQQAWDVRQGLIEAMQRSGIAVVWMDELVADACEPELEAMEEEPMSQRQLLGMLGWR